MDVYLAMAGGVVSAHLILLATELSYRAREYFWLAIRRHLFRVFLPMGFHLGAGVLITTTVYAVLPGGTLERLALGLTLGGLLATLPEAVAAFFDRRLDERLARNISKALVVFIQTSRKNFREAVHSERKRDCLEYQGHEGWWRAAPETERTRRHRLRMLYEKHKRDIAVWNRDSRLLNRDRYPAYQNFYPLVDFFGRKSLRDRLCAEAFESPREGWTGKEERTRLPGGSRDDRETNRDDPEQRIYDHEDLKREIDEGRFDLDTHPRGPGAREPS